VGTETIKESVMSEVSREFLLPNCRIRSGNVGGSGTVIYSAQGKNGFSTYILTNHHVVDNSINIVKEWSPLLKREKKIDKFSTVETHFFKYAYQSRTIGAQAIQTDIMTYDPNEDLALLKLRDEDKAPAVAKLYPRGKETELRLGMGVRVLGAALGEPPIITEGILSQFGREIENKEYWISTAPIIYGNSGGACYLRETDELIGVPARVAVAGGVFSASAITHLGFIIPITRVYQFLEDQLFRFIYDKQFTEEDEEKLREEKRKAEERKGARDGGGKIEEEDEEEEDEKE